MLKQILNIRNRVWIPLSYRIIYWVTKMRHYTDFASDRLGHFFLQHRCQERTDQSASGGMNCNHQKRNLVHPPGCCSVFETQWLNFSEFVKGMAVGLMRMWRNARNSSISRELNIHHKTIQRWWSRWRRPGTSAQVDQGSQLTWQTGKWSLPASGTDSFPFLRWLWRGISAQESNVAFDQHTDAKLKRE